MAGSRRALLGVRGDSSVDRAYKGLLEGNGYQVDVVDDPERMVELAGKLEHDRYLVDLSLGVFGKDDISPGKRVWEVVRPKLNSGKAKFLGVSSFRRLTELAEAEGIPAACRLDLRSDNPIFE